MIFYVFFTFLFSCRYHIQIQTTPAPANVIIRDIKYLSKKPKKIDGNQSTDLLEITIWKLPFQKIPIKINSYGYRMLERNVQLQRKRLLFHQINQYHFVLISEYGGAGSWSPEEPLESP